ncbi:enoyl-CoA hydratase-related protein [Sphingomonas sp.]|uniref:enoyl-CoA hydratase-related protein n=1 Tax=Sphingomonas sp. TaxID=28214 RepID=UPI002ED9F276
MEDSRLEGARLVVTRDGQVAHVELTRESRLNAMDGVFFAELAATFHALSDDSAVRAILLSARGRHFSAGLDLDWAAGQFAEVRDPGRFAERQVREIAVLQAAIEAVEAARQPVVAVLHGGVIGGGVDLACACDLRVASTDAWLQVAEIDVGITADLGTLQRLPHLIPGGIARELVLTGRRMAADEAARWGLINQLADDRDAALAAGRALAQTIAAKSPIATVGTKRSLNHSRGRPVADGLREAALWNAATLASDDMRVITAARATGGVPAFRNLDRVRVEKPEAG